MKKRLRGIKRSSFRLDFDLYRRDVPIRGIANANLSVVDIEPEGALKTIVLVHGYAGVAETWEHQIVHFALDRGMRVIAPDLRGHGQSDAPFTRYTMSELVQDLLSIADALDLPERFVLVGHSFGGSICAEFAAAHPERLEKLVLIATAGAYPLPRAAALLSRVPAAVFRPVWKYRPRWNAEVHVMKRMMLNNLRVWEGWDTLASIHTPTLILTGQRDNYFPRHVFERVGNTVPDAEVIDVGYSKHKVQLERHEAVNRAIDRFIEGSRGSGSWRVQGINPVFTNRPWLSHYDDNTPVTVPIPRQPMHKFLESAADSVPKRTATVFYGTELNYLDLEKQTNQFAHALIGLGVNPGDRVMIALPDMPQFIIAYYATLKIGGVVVLSNPDASADQIAQQAELTGCEVLVTLLAFDKLAKTVKERAWIQHVVFAEMRAMISGSVEKKLAARWGESLRQTEEEARRTREVGTLMSRLMLDAIEEPPDIDVPHDSLACIMFTSGTTDSPKGVCLTHRNIVANTLQTRHWIPGMEYGNEVFLSVLPLVHSYGMTNAMNIPIAIGATIVLHPVFELQQVLDDIRRYKPTVLPGVPAIYTAINQAPNVRSYGVASIKACMSGAAPLPVEIQEAFEKTTRGKLVEGYGLTEASPVTHINPLNGPRKTGSIGVPIPNTDAKIIDLITGETLGPGQIGELLIKGPQVMQGILGGGCSRRARSRPARWLALYRGRGGDGWRRVFSNRQPQAGHHHGGRIQRLSARCGRSPLRK